MVRRGGTLGTAGFVAFVSTALLPACKTEAPDPFLLFSHQAPQVVEVPDDRNGAARWERAASIPLPEVGRIAAVRAWQDTLLVVADALACQAHVYRLSADLEIRSVARYGRCGDGPGESRSVSDLLPEPDSLIVADEATNRLTFFPLVGGEPRELRVVLQSDDPWRVLEIVSADDGHLLLLGTLSASAQADAGMLRRVDRATGELLGEWIPDPPAPAGNRAPILRRAFVCRDPSSGNFVVASRWRVERTVLEEAGTVRAGPLVSPLAWVTAEPIPDRPGFRPSAFVRVSCAGGEALITWRTLGEDREVDRYYLEIMDMEGRVRLQEVGRSPPMDHPASSWVAGRIGEAWLAYSNRDTGPALHLFRVRD